MLPAMHACQKCPEKFTSRNKLFKHLRSKCWTTNANHASVASNAASDTSNANESSQLATQLIESDAKSLTDNGYNFRDAHYATALVKNAREREAVSCCLDTDCPLTVDDRSYVLKTFPATSIRELATPLPIRDIDNTIHKSSQYIVAKLYMNSYLNAENKQPATAKFSAEIHIVDDLKANLLVDNNVLNTQKITLNLQNQTTTLASCRNLIVPIDTTAKKNADQRRTVRSKADFKVPPETTIKVPVAYHDSLPDDRNFLFEPQCHQPLGQDDNVFAHIVDASMNHVMIRNRTPHPITLRKRARLDTLVDYNQQECYHLTPDAEFLATDG